MPFVNLIRGYKHYCNAKCELADKRVVEKAKQTYKEKTGYDHNMHNPESKERVKNTTMEKYGGIGFAVKELLDHYVKTGMLDARSRGLIEFPDTVAELVGHLD